MRNNPERFPAGTVADPARMNRWTQEIVENVEEIDDRVSKRLDAYDMIGVEMNSTQVQQNAVWLAASPTLPSGNRMRSRSDYVSGDAQHDVRYGEVTQPLTYVTEYAPQMIRVSKPVNEGEAKVWVNSYGTYPAGGVVTADASGTKRAYVRMQLNTSRIANCLIWEPYPLLTHDLISVTLFTPAGNQSIPLLASSGIETVMHGPQRFFFQDVETWGAEIEIEGTTDETGDLPLGCWNFTLARVSAGNGSASFVYTLSASALTTLSVYGEGSITTTLNTPANGKVTIQLTTPPTGPVSVVRRLVGT